MRSGRYGNDVLRFGVAVFFLWLGMSQLIEPALWSSYIPGPLLSMPLPVPVTSEQFVLVIGGYQTLLGSLIALGFLVRISAILLALPLFVAAYLIGYHPAGVLCFSFALCTLALALSRPYTEYSTAARQGSSSPRPLF